MMPLQCWLIANIFATNDIHLIVAPIIVTISTMAFIRIIHVMAGVAWFGAVVTVNTVLIPYLLSIEIGNRREVLTTLFPRIFRLASVLSLAAVLTGSALLYLMIGTEISILWESQWGLYILIGGTLATILTVFHFIIEERLEKPLGAILDDWKNSDIEVATKFLRVVPRVGLVVISTVLLLMIFASHGYYP